MSNLPALFTTALDWEVPCITSNKDAPPPSPARENPPPLLSGALLLT